MKTKVANIKSFDGHARKESFKHTLSCMARDKYLYFMLIPFLVYYLIFYYKPFGGLAIAFQDFKPFLGIEDSKWVGFQNFVNFFSGPYAWRLIRNTILINVYGLIFGFPIPIILAIFFNEVRQKRFRTMVQTISYMPHFISTVVIAGLVVNFLSPSSGIVNTLLGMFGMEPTYFLSRPEYFRTIYIVQGIWSGAGFGSIIYYSSLCSIDAELYEAATIDGAGRWKQTLHITLPGLLPTIGIMLIMNIGNLLNVGYEMIILLYMPATFDTSDVISTYMYRAGIESANYSMSTAVGLFNGVVSLILVLAANKVSKKISDVSIF